MRSVANLLLRVAMAALLALMITPLANNISGSAVTEALAAYPVPAAAEAEDKLASLAKQYGIEKPTLRFVESKVAGNTSAEKVGPENGAVVIRLGSPLQRPAYQENPEFLKAVVSHEFGHAVMIARNDDFPAASIIGMYGIGLFILLLVFPTKRGLLIGSAGFTALLAGMTMFPRWEVINNAYLALMFGMPVAACTVWLGKIRIGLPPRLVAHLPTTRNLALASLLAAPVFLTSSWAVGSMNAERELRADVIGACATSPSSMKRALLSLNDKPPSTWNEAFDHFHPPMSLRMAVLDALQDAPVMALGCAAVREGGRRLYLAGHRVQ